MVTDYRQAGRGEVWELRGFLEDEELWKKYSISAVDPGDVDLLGYHLKELKNYVIHGMDNLIAMVDSHKDKKALVMAHGPSLLDLHKPDYEQHVKITCNDFHKIEFLDDFKPDFWCGANSYEAIEEPINECFKHDITAVVTVPRKWQFIKLINISKNHRKQNLFTPWIWNNRSLQAVLARVFKLSHTYSHCNTITIHMIALALILGCKEIDIAGFDMSYSKALERTGKSHAGVNLSADINLFEEEDEYAQMMMDLMYLVGVAHQNGIVMNNLSYKINDLPKVLTEMNYVDIGQEFLEKNYERQKELERDVVYRAY